jgi:hypothetical protein
VALRGGAARWSDSATLAAPQLTPLRPRRAVAPTPLPPPPQHLAAVRSHLSGRYGYDRSGPQQYSAQC